MSLPQPQLRLEGLVAPEAVGAALDANSAENSHGEAEEEGRQLGLVREGDAVQGEQVKGGEEGRLHPHHLGGEGLAARK